MPVKPISLRFLTYTLSVGSGVLGPYLHACAYQDLAPPPVILANVYDAASTDLRDYWVSEKYDGIRAYWNGRELLTRAGNAIRAPEWFTSGWPHEAMDGELWIKRGQFEILMGTVRDEIPKQSEWRQVRFMVFDLPAHAGTFTQRLSALNALLAALAVRWVQPVEHWKVADERTLHRQLGDLLRAGGEGLMLHRGESLYRATRNDDLLKVKRYHDAEARVTGHVPGQGKYAGMLGSLEVQRADGATFRIGTGFSDDQRRNPPRIGAWVSYRYTGLTARGIPRFASFVRIREAEPPLIQTPQ